MSATLFLITTRDCERVSAFGLELTYAMLADHGAVCWGVVDRETGRSESFDEHEIAAIVAVDVDRCAVALEAAS